MMCVVARLALLLAAWLAALQGVAGCSCLLSHPQDHYCSASYVILTRVKKEIVTDKERVYRTVVKRIFKASEKDAVTLSAGKIWTALDDGMCGVQLQTNRTYVLAGRLWGGKARISLCGLHLPWDTVSPKQRKGFRLMYRQSCHCKVQLGEQFSPTDSHSCRWSTSFLSSERGADCQAEHAICMRQPGSSTEGAHCGWTGGSRYRQCMEDRRQQRDPPQKLPHREPEVAPPREPEIAPPREPEIAPHREPEIAPHREPEIVPHRETEIVPHREPEIVPHRETEIVPHREPEIITLRPEVIPAVERRRRAHAANPDRIPRRT